MDPSAASSGVSESGVGSGEGSEISPCRLVRGIFGEGEVPDLSHSMVPPAVILRSLEPGKTLGTCSEYTSGVNDAKDGVSCFDW